MKKSKTFRFFLAITSNRFGNGIFGRSFPPGLWKITFKQGGKRIVDTC